jgi:hypothetical protein
MKIELSESQLMALHDLLLEHVLYEENLPQYIDVCRQVTTTPLDLLMVISQQMVATIPIDEADPP